MHLGRFGCENLGVEIAYIVSFVSSVSKYLIHDLPFLYVPEFHE